MLRTGWKLFFSLTLLPALALCVQARNATYHLHKKAFADRPLSVEDGPSSIRLPPTRAAATLQLYDVPSDDAGAITPGGAPVTVSASVHIIDTVLVPEGN